jgi:hypothetical protein
LQYDGLHSDAKELHCDTKAAEAEERISNLVQHRQLHQNATMHKDASIAPKCEATLIMSINCVALQGITMQQMLCSVS